MNNVRKYYIEKIALDARNRLIEENIIKRDEKALNEEQLKQIVSFFGGELNFLNEEQEVCIEKTDKNKYIIHCGKLDGCLQVIRELGHAFLNLEQMQIGKKYYYNGHSEKDTEAALFARSFIMPRVNFERVISDYLNNGKFSVQTVAEEYKIDYMEVLAHVEELKIGNHRSF